MITRVQIAKSVTLSARQKTLQAALEAVVYGFGIYTIFQLAGMAVPRLTGNELAWVIALLCDTIGGLDWGPQGNKSIRNNQRS